MFVTDTHPLIWFSNGKHSQLSKKVLTIFEKAEKSESVIYIPAVVLWEIALLENLGKIKLTERFDRFSERILAKDGFEIIPLNQI
jgi:PIN domain nuclease of toxin-antitoxin system